MSAFARSNCSTLATKKAAISTLQGPASSDTFHQSTPNTEIGDLSASTIPQNAETETLDLPGTVENLRLDIPSTVPYQDNPNTTVNLQASASGQHGSKCSSDEGNFCSSPTNSNESSPATSPEPSTKTWLQNLYTERDDRLSGSDPSGQQKSNEELEDMSTISATRQAGTDATSLPGTANNSNLDDCAGPLLCQGEAITLAKSQTTASSQRQSNSCSDGRDMFLSLPNSISSSPTMLPANSRRESTKNHQIDFPPYCVSRAESDTSSKMSENSEGLESFEPPAPSTITRWDKSCRLNNVSVVQIEDPRKELTEPTNFDICLDPFSDDSRPVSRDSSIQVYNDLSFEDKWNIIFDVENGWDFIGIGSQLHAAYVSPVRNGRRFRTSCDSHLDPGRWCVDPDGFMNEARRAGGPYLCPWPHERTRKPMPDHAFYTVFESFQFIQLVVFIMAKYNIRPTSMKFLQHHWAASEFFPTTPCLVFEASRSTVDDSWVEACREIWKWAYDHCDV